jgi:hypothetical protein
MQSQLSTGIRGATRQSWNHSPRELLREILDAHPGSDRKGIFRLFRDRLDADDGQEYIETIVEYWFANNYYSLIGNKPAPQAKRREVAAQVEQATEVIAGRVRAKIKEQAKIMLLKMKLPNGKPLSECTGSECVQMGSRIGGWLAEIGRRVKPNQKVGEVMTEADLRAIY